LLDKSDNSLNIIQSWKNKIILGDNSELLPQLPSDSIDLIATDPPYQLNFMNLDWDKALPSVSVWKECLRILKPGSFIFAMCTPRQDCLSRMIVNLQDAGFETEFTSIYWCFAQGFPKAMSISKAVDKKLGAKRKIIGKNPNDRKTRENILSNYGLQGGVGKGNITEPATLQAKVLDGSYAGYQPKPALEVVIVAMKPLSEKTYLAQAMKNGKGITWLNDCRIPYKSDTDKELAAMGKKQQQKRCNEEKHDTVSLILNDSRAGKDLQEEFDRYMQLQGRFPANLLVSDNVLNDGNLYISGDLKGNLTGLGDGNIYGKSKLREFWNNGDSGQFSRFFSLDAWWEERIKQLPPEVQKTFPFLIVSKPSKSEKNLGCEDMEMKQKWNKGGGGTGITDRENIKMKNFHPTCKSLKLFSYLIVLGSRPGDLILDPYMGSGTTGIACLRTGRDFIGFEVNSDYFEIGKNRIGLELKQMKLKL